MARIGFIGGGNMAGALIGGLEAQGGADALWVVERDAGRRAELARRPDIAVHATLPAPLDCELLVLAVKPQQLAALCRQLAPALAPHRPLVLSIAAGVRHGDIARWLGGYERLVRAMPNTPALIGAGVSALYAPDLPPADRQAASALLGAVGETAWVADEAALDAVTAVSGSGPAYFFRIFEALESAAREAGLAPPLAAMLVRQTALGAARMALAPGADPAALRRQVTSPGGTTERGLAALEDHHLPAALAAAVAAAQARANELAEELATG
ncbi:MAG: pyrroline-5-carboxylate reductase [Pseudomonadota bacterium]|nr:pyrroline-5-carboxylate reductase [Pseudomonadota bacterium]HJO35858.1 pyrroline-5-carboxylate reductase [Gammaproteobacteria bacterium]